MQDGAEIEGILQVKSFSPRKRDLIGCGRGNGRRRKRQDEVDGRETEGGGGGGSYRWMSRLGKVNIELEPDMDDKARNAWCGLRGLRSHSPVVSSGLRCWFKQVQCSI